MIGTLIAANCCQVRAGSGVMKSIIGALGHLLLVFFFFTIVLHRFIVAEALEKSFSGILLPVRAWRRN